MNSHEVLKQAIDPVGAKSVAAAMNVSVGLVYKWCQNTDVEPVKNPLDRVVDLYALTKDPGIINHVCQHAGGFFAPNPPVDAGRHADQTLFEQTQKMFSDFSLLLSAITRSTIEDRSIDPREAGEIRDHWEDMKRFMETFVVRCEKGQFHLDKEIG